jgi:hypothetical protein
MPPKPAKLGWNKTDDQKKATTEKIVDTWWEDEKFTRGREFEIQLVLEKQLGNLQCDISTTNWKTKKGLATVDYTTDSVQATLGGKINPILKTNSVYVSVKNCLSFSEVNLSEHTFRICDSSYEEALGRIQYPLGLPPGWSSRKDENTGRFFFFDHYTGEKSTTVPVMVRKFLNKMCEDHFSMTYDECMQDVSDKHKRSADADIALLDREMCGARLNVTGDDVSIVLTSMAKDMTDLKFSDDYTEDEMRNKLIVTTNPPNCVTQKSTKCFKF